VHWLYITYKYDPTDSLVGSVAGLLQQLAQHVTQISVLCLSARLIDVPANVTVYDLGKTSGATRWQVWQHFYQHSLHLLPLVDGVYCQFSPDYVLALAPLLLWQPKPVVLWYTHREVSLRLRLAARLVARILTASPESCQLRSPKVQVVGHGIDTDWFVPAAVPPTSQPPLLLAVGRRAPIKHYELLIAACAQLPDFRGEVRIIGGDEGSAPTGYAAQLQAQITTAGLHERIKLLGGLPYPELRAQYQQAWLHLNLCPTGGMDKAVLEGWAAGVPTLLRNQTFAPYLAAAESAAQQPLLLPDCSAAELAQAIQAQLHWQPERWLAVSRAVRQIAVTHASQAALAQRIAAVWQSVV
jgi:glycosyltransferase involved in cell wall biosynthesis